VDNIKMKFEEESCENWRFMYTEWLRIVPSDGMRYQWCWTFGFCNQNVGLVYCC